MKPQFAPISGGEAQQVAQAFTSVKIRRDGYCREQGLPRPRRGYDRSINQSRRGLGLPVESYGDWISEIAPRTADNIEVMKRGRLRASNC